jgi:hypothetical protein
LQDVRPSVREEVEASYLSNQRGFDDRIVPTTRGPTKVTAGSAK